MDRNPAGRVSHGSSSARISDAVSGLEEFAFAFPESRDEVVSLMERHSGKGSGKKSMNEAASRIAAVGMLEILQGR